jgi:hypothetical protein
MTRLSQLTGNLRVILTPAVTIAFLLALFQQGLSLFNLTMQFVRTGIRLLMKEGGNMINHWGEYERFIFG